MAFNDGNPQPQRPASQSSYPQPPSPLPGDAPTAFGQGNTGQDQPGYQGGDTGGSAPVIAPNNPGQPLPPGQMALQGLPQHGYNQAPAGGQLPMQWRIRPSLPDIETDYVRFWRSPAYSVWKPIVGLILGVILFFVGSVIFAAIAIAVDMGTGRITVEQISGGDLENLLSPALFAANNLGLAALIGVAFLVGRAIFGQPIGYISSVIGRFRWRWFFRCLLVLLPLWIIYMAIFYLLPAEWGGGIPQLHVSADTLPLALAILLTTPLQCAGEEYGFRGLAARAGASFFRNERAGLIAGAVLSSLLFMVAHGAGDLWLNIFYFNFGIASVIMVWKTGGLEASTAVHVVNNVLAMALLPWTGLDGIFDRSAGTAGPWILIGVLVDYLALAVVWWLAERAKLERVAAPGREQAEQLAQAQDRLAIARSGMGGAAMPAAGYGMPVSPGGYHAGDPASQPAGHTPAGSIQPPADGQTVPSAPQPPIVPPGPGSSQPPAGPPPFGASQPPSAQPAASPEPPPQQARPDGQQPFGGYPG